MSDSPESAPSAALRHIDLPSLLASLFQYAVPASQALDKALTAASASDDPAEQRRAAELTSHFDIVLEWAKEHPEHAAQVVLCSIYLASGRYVVQEPRASAGEGDAAADPSPAPDPVEAI